MTEHAISLQTMTVTTSHAEPTPRPFNDPAVDCCGRDAADCDCATAEPV